MHDCRLNKYVGVHYHVGEGVEILKYQKKNNGSSYGGQCVCPIHIFSSIYQKSKLASYTAIIFQPILTPFSPAILSRLETHMALNYSMSTSSDNGFGEFILKENKHYWPRMLILVTVQFILFKFCFPFPDFISDSYNYILGAQLHLDVNIWPIGYSRFLSTFHWFTTSAFALVLFQ